MSKPAVEPSQPSIQWVPGFFLGIQRPGHEFDHSLPSNAQVKNEWSYTSIPPPCLHGVDRDIFTFTCNFDCALYLRALKLAPGRKFSCDRPRYVKHIELFTVFLNYSITFVNFMYEVGSILN